MFCLDNSFIYPKRWKRSEFHSNDWVIIKMVIRMWKQLKCSFSFAVLCQIRSANLFLTFIAFSSHLPISIRNTKSLVDERETVPNENIIIMRAIRILFCSITSSRRSFQRHSAVGNPFLFSFAFPFPFSYILKFISYLNSVMHCIWRKRHLLNVSLEMLPANSCNWRSLLVRLC